MLLVLGCGDLGAAVRRLWPGPSLGVRRAGGGDLIAGDLADPRLYDRLPLAEVRAALIAATPGLRRGRDHGLAAGAALAAARLPAARLVYSGTTAVYADAGGGAAAEDGRVAAEDPAVAGLLAIERAVLAHRDALVLRFPALVGPGRDRARDRVRAAAGGELAVAGDPDRPFSFCHEADAAELCAAALAGAFGTGTLNAAAPQRLRLRDYYAALAAELGVPPPRLVGDGRPAPSRWIDAARLHAAEPGRRWRPPAGG